MVVITMMTIVIKIIMIMTMIMIASAIVHSIICIQASISPLPESSHPKLPSVLTIEEIMMIIVMIIMIKIMTKDIMMNMRFLPSTKYAVLVQIKNQISTVNEMLESFLSAAI